MAIDYSSAFLYRIAFQPNIDVRWAIDLTAPDGDYHWSHEPMEWNGNVYSPRLLHFSGVQQQIGGLQASAPTEVTFDLANHDRFFTARPPGFFNGAPVRVRQIVPGFNSEAISAYRFFASGGNMVDPVTYRLLAEDLWSAYRRMTVPRLVYSPPVLSRFRRVPTEVQVLGQSIPFIFGPALVPLTLLDEASSGGGAGAWFGGPWQVASATGTLPSTCDVYQLFEGDMEFVNSVTPVAAALEHGSVAWRLLNQGSNPRIGGQQQLPHFERLIGSAGPLLFGDAASYTTTPYWNGPAKLGWTLLTHSWFAAMPVGFLDAQAWVQFDARWWSSPYSRFRQTWPASVDWMLGGTIAAATPLETLMDEWSFASRASLLAGDNLKPVTLSLSRAIVASLHVGNILKNSLRITDVPMTQRIGAVQVNFQRILVKTSSDGLASEDLSPGQIPVFFSVVDSGGTAISVSNRFLCADPVAAEAAQWWANFEWYGVRRIGLRSGLKVSMLEPGDLATIRHPLLQSSEDTNPMLAMVEAVTRDEDGTAFTLRSVNTPTLFSAVPPPSFDYRISAQPVRTVEIVPYNGGSKALNTGSSYTFTSCHHLIGTPRYVTTRFGAVSGLEAGYTSLVTANNSQFQVALSVTASLTSDAHVIQYWLVRR